MSKILKKEFFFTALPISYIFILFAFITFLPGYPILCGSFFLTLGIFYTFQNAREGNDVLFTALLPVKKSDVVKARFIFVVTVEAVYFIITSVITLIRCTALKESEAYLTNPLMNANILFLGFTLLIFAMFNLIFLKGFWKDAYRLGVPFVLSVTASFLVIGTGEALHHFPGLSELNSPSGMLPVQISFFFLSLIIYIIATVVSCKKSIQTFKKVEL